MFDRLIVTEPEGADFKNRSRYFLVSSLVVGVFFATAVVFSIYAAEVGLGNRDFELVSMLAPPEMVTEPERPQPERPRTPTQTQNQIASREVNMARVDEVIREIPTTVSTTQNTQQERPKYDGFKIGTSSEPVGGQPNGRNIDGVSPIGPGISGVQPQTVVGTEKDVEPPPVIKRDPPRSKTVSRGVLNGEAKNLPKPVYSAAAKAVGAQGQVNVQVTIDESGRVISANAISGHVFLRPDSERAARAARFSPTYLSDVPVKVTGVITYNFIK